MSSLCKHGELYHDCEHWECALDCIASEDEWHADIARNKIQQLQSNQDVLLEALERIEAMAERPACLCGRPTGTAAIKACVQQAIKAVKE